MSSTATQPVRAQCAAPGRYHHARTTPADGTAPRPPSAALAGGELVVAHLDAIRIACVRWVRGPDLDDCVQDAVVRALVGLDRLVDPSRIRAYLRRIARNTCVDRMRCRPPARSLEELECAPSTPVAPANDERDAMSARLRRCIDALPVQQREVVVLFYFGGLTHHQVALRMGTTITAVNQRLYRGRRALAGLLGPDGAPRPRPRPRALQGRKSMRSAFDRPMPDGRPASTTPHCA